jgi:hypothetical protein
MRDLCLIHSPPVRSDDLDFFAAEARELYRHAQEPIFVFLVVGGEGILMHGDNSIVMCAARTREVWKHLFDASDEVNFLPRKLRFVPVLVPSKSSSVGMRIEKDALWN